MTRRRGSLGGRRLSSRVLLVVVVALLLPLPLALFRRLEQSVLFQEDQHALVTNHPSSFEGRSSIRTDVVVQGEGKGTVSLSSSKGTDSPPIASTAATTTKRDQQIQNFINGKGIVLNIHITHHAGTTLCSRFGRAVGAPSKFCSHLSQQEEEEGGKVATEKEEEENGHVLRPPPENNNYYPDRHPWRAEDTFPNIQRVRQTFSFRFISWEYRTPPRPSLAHSTHWEDPFLVSVLIVRDPMERLLAGDGFVKLTFPGVSRYAKDPPQPEQGGDFPRRRSPPSPSHHEWFRFSRHAHTDNRALRILAGHDCCVDRLSSSSPFVGATASNATVVTAKTVTADHVQAAKKVMSRFTFILDQACLDDNLNALATILNVTLLHRPGGTPGAIGGRNHHHQRTIRDRIPFEDIYEYLLKRNEKDIELYQWAKRQSLVQCLDE